MLLLSRLLGAPLVWTVRGAVLPPSSQAPSESRPATMLARAEDGVQAYAGIFGQSTGISSAWSLPGESSETLLLQRTVRNIEGRLPPCGDEYVVFMTHAIFPHQMV